MNLKERMQNTLDRMMPEMLSYSDYSKRTGTYDLFKSARTVEILRQNNCDPTLIQLLEDILDDGKKSNAPYKDAIELFLKVCRALDLDVDKFSAKT
ncbi:MAG: hypothetical protein WC284_17335 [Candidimonas sp.]